MCWALRNILTHAYKNKFSSLLKFIRPDFYLRKLANDSGGRLPTFFDVSGCICEEGMDGKSCEFSLLMKAGQEVSFPVIFAECCKDLAYNCVVKNKRYSKMHTHKNCRQIWLPNTCPPNFPDLVTSIFPLWQVWGRLQMSQALENSSCQWCGQAPVCPMCMQEMVKQPAALIWAYAYFCCCSFSLSGHDPNESMI